MAQRRGYNQQHDSISAFISPENGFRGEQQKKGIQPKNHMKDNLKELRLTQSKIREQKEEAARPAKELYKLSQFKEVHSRVYQENDDQQSRNIRRPSLENGDFLAKGMSEKRREAIANESRQARAELDQKMEEAKYFADRPTTPRKAAVPKSYETAELAPPTSADFINRNKVKAITMVSSKKNLHDDQPVRHEEFGRVPEYLEERKAKWADEQEEARRRLPDPSCPRGMCLMPEEERLNTLSVLTQSKAEAMALLRKLPFVIETPSQKKRQEALENKLREIDSALAIFSKPKVYVALDK